MAVGYFPSVLADLTARAQSGEPTQFLHQRLYDGEYVCVMRKDHPLASGPFTLSRFCAARHMLVSFSGRPYGFIDEALASLGRHVDTLPDPSNVVADLYLSWPQRPAHSCQ